MFTTERSVSFSVDQKNYNLIVDKSDVHGDCLAVTVIRHVECGDVIVDLPRETFTSGPRIRVPAEMVLGKPE